jgi:hypothetical protein
MGIEVGIADEAVLTAAGACPGEQPPLPRHETDQAQRVTEL